jgi:hypothetical protein
LMLPNPNYLPSAIPEYHIVAVITHTIGFNSLRPPITV